MKNHFYNLHTSLYGIFCRKYFLYLSMREKLQVAGSMYIYFEKIKKELILNKILTSGHFVL